MWERGKKREGRRERGEARVAWRGGGRLSLWDPEPSKHAKCMLWGTNLCWKVVMKLYEGEVSGVGSFCFPLAFRVCMCMCVCVLKYYCQHSRLITPIHLVDNLVLLCCDTVSPNLPFYSGWLTLPHTHECRTCTWWDFIIIKQYAEKKMSRSWKLATLKWIQLSNITKQM